MKYVTKSCPYCHHSYQVHTDMPKYYGSPLRTCENFQCRKQFIDKDAIEIAVSGVRIVDKMKVSPANILAILMGAAIFGFGIWGKDIMVTLFGLAFLLGGLFFLWLEKETAASYSRLNNVEYARTLQNLGYAVPSKFLFPSENSADKKELALTCPSCGVELPEGSTFCFKCGYKL